MKKKILYIAVILICFAIVAGGTVAYFTAEDTARNVISSGGVGVTIVEQRLVNGQLQPYPDRTVKIMPATTVSKIVSVQSTEQAAWIRMKYAIAVYDQQGQRMEITNAELAQVIEITPDRTNWTRNGAWWYCNAPAAAGEMTAPLFETISFSGPNMGNEYQGCTAEITITAQAVQQANNGETVMEAAGWPEA